MADLIRGTTPSYIVDFTDSGVDVADITKATLTAKYRCVKTDLSDGLVLDPVENIIRYHFSQAETLAYHAGERVYLEMDVVSDGERYRASEKVLTVKNTLKDEVI